MSRRERAARGLRALASGLLLAGLAAGAGAQQETTPANPGSYELVYDVRLVPSERVARVAIRLGAGSQVVDEIRFKIDRDRHVDFAGNGELDVGSDSVTWRPKGPGSVLRYVFRVDHLRDARSYDARFAEDWALFRGDDLVPPARVATRGYEEANAVLAFRLPERWTVVVPYPRRADGRFDVEHAHRRFDRPTGWMLLGRLGVVRERVAGMQLAIAAPVGQRFRRLDHLALLRFTLPVLREAMGQLPDRMTVVGAGDPMWRGGLSGPHSLFVHSARPLISDDGTSPLLHELVHSLTGIWAAPGDDWIVEGLAEYYSLELLVRSRAMSRHRYERSLARLAAQGRRAKTLVGDRSAGAVTARAVGVFVALDAELRRLSQGANGMDDVLRVLVAERGEVSAAQLRRVAEQFSGGTSLAAFFRRVAPGVPTDGRKAAAAPRAALEQARR